MLNNYRYITTSEGGLDFFSPLKFGFPWALHLQNYSETGFEMPPCRNEGLQSGDEDPHVIVIAKQVTQLHCRLEMKSLGKTRFY